MMEETPPKEPTADEILRAQIITDLENVVRDLWALSTDTAKIAAVMIEHATAWVRKNV